jgi:hypothetical protein
MMVVESTKLPGSNRWQDSCCTYTTVFPDFCLDVQDGIVWSYYWCVRLPKYTTLSSVARKGRKIRTNKDTEVKYAAQRERDVVASNSYRTLATWILIRSKSVLCTLVYFGAP